MGSKNFPEQALLGEILAQQIEARTHCASSAVFILRAASFASRRMLSGRIDTYVEYTGTALTAILHDPPESDPRAVLGRVQREYQQRFRFEVMPSLGIQRYLRDGDSRRGCAAAEFKDTVRRGQLHSADGGRRSGTNSWSVPTAMPGLARAYGLRFAATPRILDLGLAVPRAAEQSKST